jgi:hypothetical protein
MSGFTAKFKTFFEELEPTHLILAISVLLSRLAFITKLTVRERNLLLIRTFRPMRTIAAEVPGLQI